MSITPHTKATATISAFGAIVASMFVFGFRVSSALGEKADKASVLAVSAVLADKADKKEVDELRDGLFELSAKRREDSVKLDGIRDALNDVKNGIADLKKDQQWQVQQEMKRLQWQSFKQEPVPTPTPNVNR